MKHLSSQVRTFREKFGLHVSNFPQLAPKDALDLHARLMQEELDEYRQAVINRDPAEVLDALGDLVYLAYGAAIDCGYDLDEALDRIHAANMAKLRDGVVHRRADGKVLKPEGWRPPSMAGLV